MGNQEAEALSSAVVATTTTDSMAETVDLITMETMDSAAVTVDLTAETVDSTAETLDSTAETVDSMVETTDLMVETDSIVVLSQPTHADQDKIAILALISMGVMDPIPL